MKITFSPHQRVGQSDKMLYGQFVEHFHRQVYGGLYDPESPFADADGFRTDVIEALKRIRVPIIRWPGGCFVSAYHWQDGVGKRVPAFNKSWRVEDPNTFGTDEFVKLCRKIGCEPYICTNAGTGTAEEMSNWVEYCNLKNEGPYAKERIANGSPKPHAVRYWSVGNENWGGHEMGAKDASEWGRLVKESCKMMRRVDPFIELSAASIPNLDWNVNLLRNAGKYLDWISIHAYWDGSNPDFRHSGYDTVMLRTGADIEGYIDRVRAFLISLGFEKQIKVAIDEWNLRGWYHPYVSINDLAGKHYTIDQVVPPRDRNDENNVYTMADAVFSATFLNVCLRNCDLVKMACFAPIVNTTGAIFTHKDGLVLRPQYFVFELYANLLKPNVLRTWREDVPTLTGVDKDVEKTVDLVDVVITEENGEFAAAAVNKDKVNDQMVDFRLLDGQVTQYRMHTLNGNSPDAYNDIGKTDVGIAVSPWMAFTGRVVLPPHSVSVIEMR